MFSRNFFDYATGKRPYAPAFILNLYVRLSVFAFVWFTDNVERPCPKYFFGNLLIETDFVPNVERRNDFKRCAV